MSWMKASMLPLCNISGFQKFVSFEYEETSRKRKHDLMEMTGCKPNCVSYKYDIEKVEPWSTTANNEILLIALWPNNAVVHETEVLSYDALTFVSNFGGSLGLFLGFSFFMLYDLMITIFNYLKKKFILSSQ